MKKQFIIQELNKERREQLINYILSHYKMKKNHGQSKEYMLNSKFPLVIDFEEKYFFALESITCCAIASQNKSIISFEQFLKYVNQDDFRNNLWYNKKD